MGTGPPRIEYGGVVPEATGDELLAHLDVTVALNFVLVDVARNNDGVAAGSEIAALLPRTVQARSLIEADDIRAVLTKRLRTSTSRSRRVSRDPHLIAGLIPIACGPMPDDMAGALTGRQELLEQRATGLAEDAVERRDPWTRRLGEPPRDAGAREHWMRHVRIVAAYRDRYDVDSSHPIGDGGVTDVQRLDAARRGKL